MPRLLATHEKIQTTNQHRQHLATTKTDVTDIVLFPPKINYTNFKVTRGKAIYLYALRYAVYFEPL